MTVQNAFKLRVALNNTCNYTCFFCHNEGKGDFNSNRLTLDEVVTLCRGASKAGINIFTFTGGEPFMHKQAVDILEAVRHTLPDCTIKITTNGSRIHERDFLRVSRAIDKIRLNFQSARRDPFAQLVGGDYFDHVHWLIEEFMQTDVHICLNYVYNTRSKPELPNVLEYARVRNLEVKVLELIKYSWNYKDHVDIAVARDYLNSIANLQKKDYQNDDIYVLPGCTSRIRLCYAHCNTLNGADCRLLGELRVGAAADLHHCMRVDAERLFVRGMSDDDVASKILELDASKGTCPWSIPDLVELSLTHGERSRLPTEQRMAHACQGG